MCSPKRQPACPIDIHCLCGAPLRPLSARPVTATSTPLSVWSCDDTTGTGADIASRPRRGVRTVRLLRHRVVDVGRAPAGAQTKCRDVQRRDGHGAANPGYRIVAEAPSTNAPTAAWPTVGAFVLGAS